MKVDGTIFSAMILSAANHLENHKQTVNEMNVFPVPDGDTGTNMAKTIAAAAQEMKKTPYSSLSRAANAASSAALRGARGNSGVILSQFMRGFAKGLGELEEAEVADLIPAYREAVNVAYRAVMNPTEGTILTVGRVAAETAEQAAELTSPAEHLKRVIDGAADALKQTPEMLPVLAQAGVVDAGGLGLLKILEGAYYALEQGTPVELTQTESEEEATPVLSEEIHASSPFTYCTELIILKSSSRKKAASIERELKKIGDCVLVIDDTEFAKIHVHTDHPELVLKAALTVGALTDVKIDNMKEQTEKRLAEAKAERVAAAYVGVCAGSGLQELLKTCGMTALIEGGQTMNPSAEDILNAVREANADTVFVFPNNKNIILAANQAAEMDADCAVRIIPTKNVPQCIAALSAADAQCSAEENFERMCAAIETVRTASVTYAIRNTTVGEIEVREGDFIGVSDEGVVCAETDSSAAALTAFERMVDEDTATLTVYYGEGVTAEAAEQLKETLEERFEDCDVTVYEGGQPVYCYILSAE